MLPVRLPAWKDLIRDPQVLRAGLNVWPTFLFSGVRVTRIAPDLSSAEVVLRLRPLTANFLGTQYGASMVSMVDPFWVTLLTMRLGPEYQVWDARLEVEFLKPGRTDVRVQIEIPDDFVEEVVQAAAGGEKVLRWVSDDVVDRSGAVVCRVRRQLYIRKKR